MKSMQTKNSFQIITKSTGCIVFCYDAACVAYFQGGICLGRCFGSVGIGDYNAVTVPDNDISFFNIDVDIAR